MSDDDDTTVPTKANEAPAPQKRNAFALMTSSSASAAAAPSKKPKLAGSSALDGLLPYIERPASFPPSILISHTPTHVAIRDLYPKASVHTLLIPRSHSHMLLHPITAFDDAPFLAATRAAASTLADLVAAELSRRFGAQDGRDWRREVRVGVHLVPSMNHLHVHVLSRENRSERLKTAKHYLSFNSPFFVALEEFPLKKEDWRRGEEGRRRAEGLLKGSLVCWRCGEGFGRAMKRLKGHLEVEFGRWKVEGGGEKGGEAGKTAKAAKTAETAKTEKAGKAASAAASKPVAAAASSASAAPAQPSPSNPASPASGSETE
ncbi:HIT-like domain-containing protein [Geopyxis carbonaria]|nr:HIT-like domain-containing protein [Geopyxis carbonaria]